MQFIVTQEPRSRYRAGLVITVVVTEAASKAAALRQTADRFHALDKCFHKPKAEALKLNSAYSI